MINALDPLLPFTPVRHISWLCLVLTSRPPPIKKIKIETIYLDLDVTGKNVMADMKLISLIDTRTRLIGSCVRTLQMEAWSRVRVPLMKKKSEDYFQHAGLKQED